MGHLRTVRRRISEEPVKRSISRILRGTTLCSMATVAANRAHINTAYFCYSRELELFYLSDPEALHSRNLTKNASMGVTVFDTRQTWGRTDRGLQMFGTCREARGRTASTAERLYGNRFPLYRRWLEENGPAGSRVRSYRFYRFVPARVKVLDERVFGGGVFVEALAGGRRLRPSA